MKGKNTSLIGRSKLFESNKKLKDTISDINKVKAGIMIAAEASKLFIMVFTLKGSQELSSGKELTLGRGNRCLKNRNSKFYNFGNVGWGRSSRWS